MEQSHKPTILQMQVSLPKQILISTGIMFALIFIVYQFAVPNPNMILIAGLVFCSALFGFGGGLVAAVIMLGYTLYFFSTDHSFVHFTSQNMQKVIVSLAGITADMLLVCFLKQAEIQAFRRVADLTRELHEENEKLQHMSQTDALTGIRNRLALRADLSAYRGQEVTVMMMDLNNFKTVNDTHGHEEGDRILRETGRLLADTFGPEHCYRYGGDEFLVILPGPSYEDFLEKLSVMQRSRPLLGGAPVTFSCGSVHALAEDDEALREIVSRADEKMYAAKREKGREIELAPEPVTEEAPAEIKRGEYSVEQMRALLHQMQGRYDLARVVDPEECCILEFGDDGRIRRDEHCYSIWQSDQKCLNCSSAQACRTGCHQQKAERFQDKLYLIQSAPVTLRLENGSVYDAVVELVKIEEENEQAANDREAENVGSRAVSYRAHHDSLTKVLNAEAFYELARERLREGEDAAWVMVTSNIMNFRLVNTLFGVTKGNEVLVRTAALLRAAADRAEGLCGRLGGDQFALLLPKERYREENFRRIAEALAGLYNSGIYTLCIHFGIYEVEDPSVPVSVMCGRANSALRTIREDMTHTIAVFNNDIRQKLLFEQQVIGGFDEALRGGQFEMYLQPLVGEDGGVLGAEALARWRRPDGSLVMPGDFIETLENAGLIQKLDQYIWELAVRQLAAWKGTENENLSISVNMSAKDFYSIDIYRVLTELVERYGVDSRLLRLEITESALLVEPDKSDAIVSRLRRQGFVVEIDDFGKGYSSLSLLKNIQADVLKIDMGFLREIHDHERSRAILQSILSLAETLGMEVITEGVETEQQLRALSEMGCRHFQGYYFSRPIPVAEFEEKFAMVS